MDNSKDNPIDQSEGTYSLEFKALAVRQLKERGCRAAELGLEIGVHPDTLLSWKREFESDNGRMEAKDENSSEEAEDLELELEKLKKERNRLRASITAAEPGLSLSGSIAAAQPKSLIPSGTLLDIFETLFASRWLMFGIIALFVLVGVGHTMIAQPVYRADGLLEVGEAENDLAVTEHIPTFFKEATPVNAEIEMLRSRVVLGQVVDNLDLTVTVRPIYFPVIGAAIVRWMVPRNQREVEGPLLGLKRYAWGGEQIKVENFSVPDDRFGEIFTIAVDSQNNYRLLDDEGNQLLKGKVGEFEAVQLSGGELLTLFITELDARSNTRFEIKRESRLDTINIIKDSLVVREKGLGTRLLEIIFDWEDESTIGAITNEIVNIYVQQNSDRKSGEIKRTIAFLNNQLDFLRQQMQKYQTALNDYRLTKGVNDLSNESKIILQKIVTLDSRLSQLKSERQQLIQIFTPQHSRILSIDRQISTLEKELNNLNWKVKRLPNTQEEVLRLTRDVEVNTELYGFMFNRLQELKMVDAGPIGNVNIIDYPATLRDPIKPQVGIIITLYVLLGIVIAIVAVFIRKALHAEIDNPDILETRLGYPVYAIIPHSPKQNKLVRMKGAAASSILIASESTDPASESIRSLRTSLHFALLDAKNNILLISGPGSDIGKSFLSANLAAVLATAGKRVLLIDGDLRKGQLNKTFGIHNKVGLSNVIAGSCELEQAIHKSEIENLFFIPTGTYPPNPSELLLHRRFAWMLDEVASRFDHVVIDSPPILPVTDAAIIGNLAGATLMVVKAGSHTLRAIEESVKRLTQSGANVRGFVFNDLVISKERYGNAKYYGYDAKYYSK